MELFRIDPPPNAFILSEWFKKWRQALILAYCLHSSSFESLATALRYG